MTIICVVGEYDYSSVAYLLASFAPASIAVYLARLSLPVTDNSTLFETLKNEIGTSPVCVIVEPAHGTEVGGLLFSASNPSAHTTITWENFLQLLHHFLPDQVTAVYFLCCYIGDCLGSPCQGTGDVCVTGFRGSVPKEGIICYTAMFFSAFMRLLSGQATKLVAFTSPKLLRAFHYFVDRYWLPSELCKQQAAALDLMGPSKYLDLRKVTKTSSALGRISDVTQFLAYIEG